MLNIPVLDVYSQTFSVTLASQNCQISVYQKSTGLFMDVSVNNDLIIGGVICENVNRIVRDLYLGFVGDFIWYDTQGVSDPSSPGLGTRYLLLYLTAAELNGVG